MLDNPLNVARACTPCSGSRPTSSVGDQTSPRSDGRRRNARISQQEEKAFENMKSKIERRSIQAEKGLSEGGKLEAFSQQLPPGVKLCDYVSLKDLKVWDPSMHVPDRWSYARKVRILNAAGILMDCQSNKLNKCMSMRNRIAVLPPGDDPEEFEEDDSEATSSEEEGDGFQCGHLLWFVKKYGPRLENKPEHGGCKHKLLRQLAKGNSTVLEYATDAIKRDELMSFVMEDLTHFYKNASALEAANKGRGKVTAWPETSMECIRAKFRTIIGYKKEVACLNTEIHNWCLKHKLFNSYVPSKFETVHEKHRRMDEFWTQHAAHFVRNDLPPRSPTSRDCTPLLLSSDSVRKTKPMMAPINFNAEQQWDMVSLIESSKIESTGSRKLPDKYGLAWHGGAKEMRWQALEPAEGTRAALIARQQAGKRRYALERQNTERQNTPATDEKTQSCLSSSSSALGLKTSSSAPTLHPGLKLPALSSPKMKKGEQPLLTDHPTQKYLEACKTCWTVPTPLPFVTGHSWKLHASNKNMCDNDLRAMAVMLQEVSSIEEVDIGSNALLTEKALVPFLERLFCESAARDLHALVLNDLKHMGARSIETITRLLSDGTGLRSVRLLNLSHVSITMKCYQGLAKAVRHHESIETLNLSDTGLGSNPWISKQCIVDILCCATLRNLDIGWNCFDVDFFVELGNNVIEKRRLETLSIANCSSQCLDTSRSNPSSFFFELIAQDKALTCLDASLNHMDFRAALVLEDSLTCHKSLKKLDISHNPLGTLGIRSAMRLLASQTSGLTNFEFAGCYDGTVANFQSINMTNPGGHYSLDMSKPYDRSMLRILYKYCEKFQLLPENAFTQVSWRGGWSHAMKNAHGLYEVPTSGNLSFVFSLDQAIEQRIKGIADDDYSSFIDKHMEIAKTKPAFNKLVPLFSSWELQKGHSKDQLVWLNALAKDFVLTPGQLEHLCNVKHTAMRTDIVYHLLPCVIGGETAETLSMGLFPSIGEFLKTHRILRRYIDFNIENPTGHYRLSLDINTDYAIAEKLCLLDRWEVVLDHRHGRADLSQRGNRSHFRNEEYAERSLHSVVESIATWTLPETDVLEFDYVTSKRCPKGVGVLSDRVFSNILVAMFDAECNDVSKLQVLRMLSHLFYLTSTQMRELLSFFKDASYRADIFVNFYVRVVDMWNQKIFRVSFSSEDELTRARNRLGHALAFPFVQPENIQLRADFAHFDERLAANILLMIAAKECAGNIREPQYVDANGVVDPLTTGVPRRWETFADMPKDGIFTCSYVCAPENRNFNVRTSLAEQMATFRMDVQEDEVEWWTGLTEVPPDVLDLLDWLLGNFEDVSKAFTLIDGVGGNGVISLREFEEGLTNLNCKKFEGKNGKLDYERIATIFRYLDPGGEGSVSEGEWAILDQLWKEYQLCIAEFVHFIQRIFGDDIMDAWEFLDLDESGELTMEEWLEGVENIGYFGPAKCVFALIDNSDDGNISKDEFVILDKYKR